jgi:hypothetical protein
MSALERQVGLYIHSMGLVFSLLFIRSQSQFDPVAIRISKFDLDQMSQNK